MDKNSILNRKETIRYLGYKKGMPDDMMMYEIQLCEEEFLKVVEPKFYYRVYDLRWEQERLTTADDDFIFPGNSIRKHLIGCQKVAFSCATLSCRVDELIDQAQAKGEMLHALIYDAIANAAVEEVRYKAEHTLAQEFKEYSINWQFGIGYGDLPLSLQPKFLDKIGAKQQIGIIATEHFLLNPLKSITGFIGLRREGTGQESCGQQRCSACDHNVTCIYKK